MLTFEKITIPGVEYPLQSYRFLRRGDEIEGFGVAECPADYAEWEWENKISRITDSLWDGYGSLCRGSDGRLYGIEYVFSCDHKVKTGALIPAAWACVEKIEEGTDHD